MPNLTWHQQTAADLSKALKVDLGRGLPTSEARKRLAVYGPNRLAEEVRTPLWRMLAEQFKDFMVLTLIAATVISFALGETADGVTILAIVLINGVLGFVQEFRRKNPCTN